LPFSDHCEPLVNSEPHLEHLLRSLRNNGIMKESKYTELRPMQEHACDFMDLFQPSDRFFLHRINLQPELPQLFSLFHKDSIQRRIRKAEKEHLNYECGRSEALLRKYYKLALLTRRRHRVPPQSMDWYRNLLLCLGEAI